MGFFDLLGLIMGLIFILALASMTFNHLDNNKDND